MMSTFASTESDLSQRIRRTLHGRAPRMGPRARVLAAVLLCPLAAVTLPSYGAADNWVAREPASAITAGDSSAAATGRDEVLTLEELTDRMAKGIRMVEETHTEGVRSSIVVAPESGGVTVAVRGRLEAMGTSEIMDLHEAIARAMEVEDIEREAIERVTAENDDLTGEEKLRRILEAVVQSHILKEAVATDPDEWSDELKTRLLELRPGSTIEEIAEVVRNARTGAVVHGYSLRGQNRTERANLFLVVDRDDNMKLNNDKPVTLDTLAEELKKQRSLLDSTSMIIIQVHEDATRAHIREIMDIARKAGLVDQIIATEP